MIHRMGHRRFTTKRLKIDFGNQLLSDRATSLSRKLILEEITSGFAHLFTVLFPSRCWNLDYTSAVVMIKCMMVRK